MPYSLVKFTNELCTELGFCVNPNLFNENQIELPIEADEFACLILKAEEMDPEIEIKWRRKICNFSSKKWVVLSFKMKMPYNKAVQIGRQNRCAVFGAAGLNR